MLKSGVLTWDRTGEATAKEGREEGVLRLEFESRISRCLLLLQLLLLPTYVEQCNVQLSLRLCRLCVRYTSWALLGLAQHPLAETTPSAFDVDVAKKHSCTTLLPTCTG